MSSNRNYSLNYIIYYLFHLKGIMQEGTVDKERCNKKVGVSFT